MRNTMGAYIDAATDGAKDRVVEAMLWRSDKTGIAGRERCLVGHVEDWGMLPIRTRARDAYARDWINNDATTRRTRAPSTRFDDAVLRFGLDRVVRAVKLRAGATLPTEIEHPTEVCV